MILLQVGTMQWAVAMILVVMPFDPKERNTGGIGQKWQGMNNLGSFVKEKSNSRKKLRYMFVYTDCSCYSLKVELFSQSRKKFLGKRLS